MGVTQAVYERLAFDSALASMLASFEGRPAIFTYEPVPGDAPLPYILTAGDLLGRVRVPESTKLTYGARVARDVRIFAEASGSMAQVEAIAERVWELFEKAVLFVPGWTQVLRSRADRPIIGPRDERVYMLIVSVTISVSREG
jgi:hypothetical protein